MNAAQLARKTADLDREMVVDEFKPLSKRDRERWEKARRKPGRPRRGRGVKVISVSVEKGLLSVADALAKSLGISRAGLIERGLKAVLAAEGRL
jgi:ribosomal protein S8